MKTESKNLLYRILFIAVSIVFIIVFVLKFGTLQDAIETLSHGSIYFLGAALLIQLLGIINKGAYYQALYDYFGARDKLKKWVILTASANFVNLIAPTGGLSGMAVFVSEAEEQGMTKSRATFVNIFSYFLLYGVFLLVLLFGLFYLMFNHQLYQYQIVTASVLFGMIFFMLVFLAVTAGEAARLHKLFQFFASLFNFFARLVLGRKAWISKGDVSILSHEINDCLKIIQRRLRGLWLPIFHVILIEIVDLLTLYYVFLAFQFPIYPGVLISVYAISVLFSLISITPNGLGVVEALMIVVLTNFGVPVELATICVLGYRLLTFWIPFLIGYFGFRTFQKEKLIRIQNGIT